MLSAKAKKALILLGTSAIFFCLGTAAFAVSGQGIGMIASNVKSNFSAMAQLITAGSYVAGLAFGVAAIVKFKAHKDAPTQVTIGQPIALLFVSAALVFIPGVLKSSGRTLFVSGSTAGISGITSVT